MPALHMWQLECSLFVHPTNGSLALPGRSFDLSGRRNRPMEPALNIRQAR